MLEKESQTIHDARTGFNDIKPPPVFSPVNYAYYISLIIIFSIILYLIFKVIKSLKTTPIKKELTKEQIAIKKLEALDLSFKNNKTSKKDFVESTSMIIREYLEKSFEFPAKELTSLEIYKKIENIIPSYLKDIKSILSFLEFITYSPTTLNRENKEISLENVIKESKSLIEKIFKYQLEEEEKRKKESLEEEKI